MSARLPFRTPRAQTGATLIVGLVLLLVLTLLGVSGMSMSRLEVQMAGNTQFQQDAFQMAETGIDVAIARRNYTTNGVQVVELLGDTDIDRSAVTEFIGTTPVPDIAFSMGTNSGSIAAYHFDIEAVGRGPRNASSVHHQSFYVIGPSSTELTVNPGE
jgi:type IV pilus assembly protein PilX